MLHINSGSASNKTLIWLHGLGADSNDFAPFFSNSCFNEYEIILPNAPHRKITLNQNFEMRAWFDMKSLNLDDLDEEDFVKSSKILDSIIVDKLKKSDLYSLENYAVIRDEFRAEVMKHKKLRNIQLGENLRLLFEDRMTMQYQIQEMLRIEKIFEAEGIDEELDAYNPLIPDGQNLKAVMMIEFSDVEERKDALAKLIGVEREIWLQVEGFDKVYPISNEDLDRETDEKTSSVHFMRFEFSSEMIAALKDGAVMKAGVDHPEYQYQATIEGPVRQSLVADFD